MFSFNRKMAQSRVFKVFSLKSIFEKLRFRDRLVWPEDQTIEIKLRDLKDKIKLSMNRKIILFQKYRFFCYVY